MQKPRLVAGFFVSGCKSTPTPGNPRLRYLLIFTLRRKIISHALNLKNVERYGAN